MLSLWPEACLSLFLLLVCSFLVFWTRCKNLEPLIPDRDPHSSDDKLRQCVRASRVLGHRGPCTPEGWILLVGQALKFCRLEAGVGELPVHPQFSLCLSPDFLFLLLSCFEEPFFSFTLKLLGDGDLNSLLYSHRVPGQLCCSRRFFVLEAVRP